MKAKEFNQRYPIGTAFFLIAQSFMRGGPLVRTMDVARDFECGSIVEINKEPYFAKVETLQELGRTAD